MRISNWLLGVTVLVLNGCSAPGLKPVEIFPEDNCAQCRMAVSDERYASEIIDQNGEAFKFDDLGCMLKFRSKHADLKIAGIYLKDYETKQWMPYERAAIVETGVETPMGSGKVAFADPQKAMSFQKQYPQAANAGGVDKCCE